MKLVDKTGLLNAEDRRNAVAIALGVETFGKADGVKGVKDFCEYRLGRLVVVGLKREKGDQVLSVEFAQGVEALNPPDPLLALLQQTIQVALGLQAQLATYLNPVRSGPEIARIHSDLKSAWLHSSVIAERLQKLAEPEANG